MISYIKGRAAMLDEERAVIENNGIGYELFVTAHTASRLINDGDEAKAYTYMSVKEDGITLFGFYSKEERELFLRLISVNGVGPKSALAILSGMSITDLAAAIMTGDERALLKAPGIGKKTAARIILELKDKIDLKDALTMDTSDINIDTGAKGETVEALLALGFGRADAVRAVNAAFADGMTSSEALSLALKVLSKEI